MKRAGQIALTRFPFTNLQGAKLRPVVLIKQATRFDDWLVCMITSQLDQADPDLDEVISSGSPDFAASGLKVDSAIRLTRLAVIDGQRLAGSIGAISDERLVAVRKRLARWIEQSDR